MPKNYQISQYDEPLCVEGYLDVERRTGATYRVGIERVHMEEDTGKNTHVGTLGAHPRGGVLARRLQPCRHPARRDRDQAGAGTGRLAPEVARAYVTALRDILRTLGVSDVRMEQGSLRCDVNTSLSLPGRRSGAPAPRPRT